MHLPKDFCALSFFFNLLLSRRRFARISACRHKPFRIIRPYCLSEEYREKKSVFCPITFLNSNSMPGVVFVINELTIQFVRHHGRFNFICSLDIPSHISVNVSRTIFKAICIFKMSVFKGTKTQKKEKKEGQTK